MNLSANALQTINCNKLQETALFFYSFATQGNVFFIVNKNYLLDIAN